MRKVYSILVFLFVCISFMMSSKQPDDQLSKGEQLVNGVLAKTAKIIKSQFDMKPSGESVAMPGGPIQELGLCFDTKHPCNKEQLRVFLIKSANELLNQLNENKEIQTFLKERPFTMHNIQIIIYNHDKEGREVYDPGIATAQISRGVLTYRTVDATDTFKFKQQWKESYEEALKALSHS